MPASSLSHHVVVPFLCVCGRTHPAHRWWRVDADADPEQAIRLRMEGPFHGNCPSCGEPARGAAPFAELSAAQEECILWIPANRRGEIVEALVGYLERLREAPQQVHAWMLRPRTAILEPEEHTGRYEALNRNQPMTEDLGVPRPIGQEPPPPGVAFARGTLGVLAGELVLDGEVVRLEAEVSAGVAETWAEAELTVRPVHLRAYGYPLVGVRVIGDHDGDRGVIDAVLDVGRGETGEVFRVLAGRFEVHVCVYASGGMGSERGVRGQGLERNAALCVESARGVLASGEFPPEAFEAAVEALNNVPATKRLAVVPSRLVAGAYQHLLGAAETRAAVKQLEEVSKREMLARILEVEGLPFAEFDSIRRRILEASVTAGLCVPRRFWRRIVASGLVGDLKEYAARLAGNRAAVEADDDLDEEARIVAWQAIWELCDRKNLAPPPELREALGFPEPLSSDLGAAGSDRRFSATAGEIGGPATPDTAVRFQQMLADPERRLGAAAELLAGQVDDRALALVLDALEQLDDEELLAVLPDLSELGSRAVPGLVAKLHSERRQVRHAAVIVLGLAMAPEALDALIDHLVWEPTTVWVDVARALGPYGDQGLDMLVDSLVDLGRQGELLGRVARAMAEVVLAKGPNERKRVESMAENEGQPLVATAARQALATLADVSESGAQVRGELPFPEVTEVRGFARKAYEAIMIPELEILDEVELDS